jgi:hypothetical protein
MKTAKTAGYTTFFERISIYENYRVVKGHAVRGKLTFDRKIQFKDCGDSLENNRFI